MFAAANGRSETVRLLLDRGADIHATGRGGDALFGAAEEGHADVVKLLIDRGSDIDIAVVKLEMCANDT
ncbi:MAG: ankyrin repeat domain-containing protein, partial [Syntrophales bacterium]|nr:ankyrin repeat domain-containing protein [Syntrophales bacterium]